MSLLSAARRLAKFLPATGYKIVFAESCTGGLASASLARVPGISAHHCGGMVTYRDDTKTAWLGIDPKIIKRFGPVSEQVAVQMADNVLALTPEATIALSVTGHLGPHAPPKLDGVVYIGVACYMKPRRDARLSTADARRLRLSKRLDRAARQKLAAEETLKLAAEVLDGLLDYFVLT